MLTVGFKLRISRWSLLSSEDTCCSSISWTILSILRTVTHYLWP